MNTLSTEQVRRLNESAIHLYSEVNHGDFEDAATSSLDRLVHGEIALIGVFNGNTGQVTGRITPEVSKVEEARANFNRWGHQHPGMGRRTQHAQSLSEHLSRREWHRRDLFAVAFRPFGMEDDLGLEVELESKVTLFVGKLRSRRSFTREERELVTFLGPHLRLAWQQSQVTRRLPQPLPRTVEAEIGQGVLEVDGRGRVLACGALSNEWLHVYFGMEVAGDSLPGELRDWFLRQQGTAQRKPWRVRGMKGTLTIRYVPEGAVARHFLILQEEHAALEIGDAARLRPLGLTPREEQVLFWVSHGKSNGAVSMLMGIMPGTVKRHLENIYVRLGVEDRHGATLCALQCLRRRPA